MGIGLGIFSGDAVGIGIQNRALAVKALRTVLEEEKFENIKVIIFSMPIFKRPKDNFHYFKEVNSLPVCIDHLTMLLLLLVSGC